MRKSQTAAGSEFQAARPKTGRQKSCATRAACILYNVA